MNKTISRLLTFSFNILLIICLSNSCADTDGQKVKSKRLEKEKQLRLLSTISALPKDVKSPSNNPVYSSKVELGRLLFFDPILSGDKDVACATCHHPDHGYAEFRDISIGVNGKGFGSKRTFNEPNDIPFVKRNAHTILNTAFNGIDIFNKYDPSDAPMFWDSRVNSLEDQALEPLKALEEMRGRNYSESEILDEIVKRLKLNAQYQELFSQVFNDTDPIQAQNIAKAIATFERSLVTNNSRFDRYMRGDKEALSISEKEGFNLFKAVGCANCHNGPMFSDYKMHVLGVPPNEKLPESDKGLDESYAFRTPSLRNLRFTAPYMHNGSLKTLQQVLEFYEDISDNKQRNPEVPLAHLDPLVKELNLRVRDMSSIINFLNTLNESNFDKQIPESVPSGLPVGGNIN